MFRTLLAKARSTKHLVHFFTALAAAFPPALAPGAPLSDSMSGVGGLGVGGSPPSPPLSPSPSPLSPSFPFPNPAESGMDVILAPLGGSGSVGGGFFVTGQKKNKGP